MSGDVNKEISAETSLEEEDLSQVTGGSNGKRLYRKVKTIVDILRNQYGGSDDDEEQTVGRMVIDNNPPDPSIWHGPLKED